MEEMRMFLCALSVTNLQTGVEHKDASASNKIEVYVTSPGVLIITTFSWAAIYIVKLNFSWAWKNPKIPKT